MNLNNRGQLDIPHHQSAANISGRSKGENHSILATYIEISAKEQHKFPPFVKSKSSCSFTYDVTLSSNIVRHSSAHVEAGVEKMV
jgi:uncharacterized membrane protein